ncbi:hypothetical protein ACQKQD_03660 [Methylobacterium sp. NPDC080182]|uniref:hypothetical protein n=1 Tax=Methylobacterium sp. NPDC080182 TaxID=3390590 RepID=UPI003D02396A
MEAMNLKSLRRTHSGGIVHSGNEAWMKVGYGPELTPASVDFSVRFTAGKGTAEAVICVQPKDFERVAQAMMDVDPAAAIKAFGAAVVGGNQSVRNHFCVTSPLPCPR